MRTVLASLFALLAAAVGAGCGPKPDPETVTYVGIVDGTDAVIGLAVKGGLIVGYVCGGTTTLSELTTWLSRPDREGNTFELSRGDGKVDGVLGEGVITGVVTMGAATHTFTAPEVLPGGQAGLYGAGLDDADCLTGVVVLPDGRTQGASTCGSTGIEDFNQVTPTAVPDPEGFAVAVQGWSGPVFVTPVTRAARY